MKKFIKLLFVLVLCLSVCGCSKQEEGNGEAYLTKIKDNEYCLEFPDQKSYQKSIRRIEITQENWDEYFEDYTYIEEVTKKNDKGIEETYDALFIGFGLKKDVLGCVYNVSFQLDGYAMYEFPSYKQNELKNLTYNLYEINNPYYQVVQYSDNKVVKQELVNAALKHNLTSQNDMICYNINTNSNFKGGIQMKDARVYGAKGILLLVDVPEGFYNGEKITKINYGYGRVPFNVGNLSMYFKGEPKE